ncbi:MAG: hypothetical protein VKL00_10065, partial [Synechococcales bacterium]|nr:hypothetical protein [Synechococcales bacterium]
FTEDSGDIQVRYDIVHIAEAFSSSNLVSAFSFTFVYPIELTLYWSCYPYGAFLLSRLTSAVGQPRCKTTSVALVSEGSKITVASAQ